MTRKRRGRWLLWISPQGGLFSGMALAGLIAVALTVTADRGNAGGIDGLRAVVPGPSAPAGAVGSPPVLTASPATPVPTAPRAIADPAGAGVPIGVTGATPTATPTATPVAGSAPATAPVPTAPEPALLPAPPAATTPPPVPATPGPAAAPAPAPTPTPVVPVATPAPVASVALTTDRGTTALVLVGGLVPGDSITRTLSVRNTGTSDFRYTVSATQTAATSLWTDPIDGLQLTLRTPGGVVLYGGPLSGLGAVAAPNVVPAGGTDDLVYAFSLPVSASNAFQGLVQDLTIVLTAVQYP